MPRLPILHVLQVVRTVIAVVRERQRHCGLEEGHDTVWLAHAFQGVKQLVPPPLCAAVVVELLALLVDAADALTLLAWVVEAGLHLAVYIPEVLRRRLAQDAVQALGFADVHVADQVLSQGHEAAVAWAVEMHSLIDDQQVGPLILGSCVHGQHPLGNVRPEVVPHVGDNLRIHVLQAQTCHLKRSLVLHVGEQVRRGAQLRDVPQKIVHLLHADLGPIVFGHGAGQVASQCHGPLPREAVTDQNHPLPGQSLLQLVGVPGEVCGRRADVAWHPEGRLGRPPALVVHAALGQVHACFTILRGVQRPPLRVGPPRHPRLGGTRLERLHRHP
mmetsp:Transcript_38398/g.103990  ORF Transcript_38398/g.103990 Transcript_38398/m.103990 type:complete len:330 (-) Transcript_38398:182-1171(-)